MGHPEIATCGEPWLALPLALMDQKDEAYSTYGHFSLVNSIHNLHGIMDGGRDAYLEEAGKFVEAIYQKANKLNTTYFLDKTPRYYKIFPELQRMFPEAKFIFLTRSPLAVFGSILNYVDGKVYRLPTWRQDIVDGVPCLASAIETNASNSRVLRFEDLVQEPGKVMGGIFEMLDLSWDEDLLYSLSERSINLGDPHGEKQYQSISHHPLDNWRQSINSSTKKKIAYSWINAVSEDYFLPLGTTKREELSKCDSITRGFSPKDACARLIGECYFYNALNVVRWSWRRRCEGKHPALY